MPEPQHSKVTAVPTAGARALYQAAAWIARLLVAALFAYTGLTKILAPLDFIKEVRYYQILPVVLSNLVAYVLPWLEVLAALLLAVGFWRKEARLVIAAMLVVFAGAKTFVLGVQGRSLEDCGCVPTESFLHFLFAGWLGVATNLGLLGLLALELWASRRLRAAPTAATPPSR